MSSPDTPGERTIRATDYLTGDSFVLRETAAGWWAVTPVPEDLGRYYPAAYYGGGGRRFPAPVERLQAWLYRGRARRITRRARKTGRVLDVGCGPGHLLAQFRSLGWEVTGTEATLSAAAIPQERYGLDVRAGELRALQFEPRSFDAIVSWHTLEHMSAPLEVLDEIARLLKPGGLFFVSVPDFASHEASVQPAAWFHLDVPRHLAHFPAAMLREQLRRRGFVIEEETFSAPEYDVFSLVQTWQNRWGLPQNLLYLMLKSARRLHGPEPTLFQRCAAIVGAALLAPWAVVMTAWRSWRKTGAVIVILARKG